MSQISPYYDNIVEAPPQQVAQWDIGSSLILGNTSYGMDGEWVVIPTRDTHGHRMRVSIFIVAPAGRGKTKLLKNLITQIRMLTEYIAVFCDPRMEMMDAATKLPAHSEYFPVGFKPAKLPIKTYIPKYCLPKETGFDSDPDGIMALDYKMREAVPFCVSMGSLGYGDMITLLKYTRPEDEKSARKLWQLWKMFTSRFPNPENRTMAMFLNMLTSDVPIRSRSMSRSGTGAVELGGIHMDTISKIYDDVNTLGDTDVIGFQNTNMIMDIQNGMIPVLSNMDSEYPHFDSAYASVVANQIYRERQRLVRGDTTIMKPVWYVADELQRIGFKGSSFAYFCHHKVLRQGRVALQNFIGATQTIVPASTDVDREEIDRNIPMNCDYIICFKLDSINDIDFIASCKHLNKSERAILEDLHFDKERWISEAVLLSPDRPPQTFYPLPPLAGHKFETEH